LRALKSIVAAAIALAIAVAPLGAASAKLRAVSSVATTATLGTTAEAALVAQSAAYAGGMDAEDCAKMMSASKSSDCACCDTAGVCPPELCPFTVFKVFGKIEPLGIVHASASSRLQFGTSERPPDWINSPQPPPPRA
jgi:hypothetical protein